MTDSILWSIVSLDYQCTCSEDVNITGNHAIRFRIADEQGELRCLHTVYPL